MTQESKKYPVISFEQRIIYITSVVTNQELLNVFQTLMDNKDEGFHSGPNKTWRIITINN